MYIYFTEDPNDKMLIDKPTELTEGTVISPIERKYRKFICCEEALKISSDEPYCLRRPIRRGHFNVSQYYPMQQVRYLNGKVLKSLLAFCQLHKVWISKGSHDIGGQRFFKTFVLNMTCSNPRFHAG